MGITFDYWILGLSALTVGVTIWMGFWAAKRSRTASDFFVAGRGVSVGWNASAISGEYLSAASFMGIAGMVMSSGYDALWYPVCYACGYLFLLLFIAGPLRRFGAYTIPDFAEGRYDSPLFRKIAVIFVLFIGFFYTMPQMKGAGTTLAYIFPGLPYWAGVVLVGSVITLNVALGGMKGITLVQAFQYWMKMFAISVPIFVLMSVYGHYGRQVGAQQAGGQGAAGIRMAAGTGSNATESASVAFEGAAVTTGARFDPLRPNLTGAIDVPPLGVDLPRDREQSHLVTLSFTPMQAMEWAIDPRAASGPVRDALATADAPSFFVGLGEFEVELPDGAANALVNRQFARLWGDSGNLQREPLPAEAPADATWLDPFGPLTSKAARAANLSPAEAKPYALLYTYSLIIALVCGTAGLPHILVRFYTNPDGVAARRTTMWVMILIGTFYVFPPIFGVMGRNLLPELYSLGPKGTDKVVLQLPRMLNEEYPMLGSILSGVTCAGAFAAFMSTFSGLLVSMTGALAHDIYGRVFFPRSTAAERMRMFRVFAWVIGGIATGLGCFVQRLEINFMVGQAFAIAAASYFPLLFMSVWWRGMTMRGAATGMLAGGISAVLAVTITNFSDLGVLPLQAFWAAHPLLRILLEQPAIWAVPGAILLMIVVSRVRPADVPADVQMKMLVLHAPESLGLKQEYIREHESAH